MKNFERKTAYDLKLKFWLRYVEDSFSIWRHGKSGLNEFLQHLCSIEESDKLTMEIESENKMPFLDLNIKIEQ